MATNIPFRPRKGITILVADDFAAFRRFVREKLLENGFQTVAEATDGLEAVAKAPELRPSVVLLDISMPNQNGIEAAAQIRSIAPESKVLFISQITDLDIVAAALSDGAAGYLHKSAIIRDLLPAIETVLAGKIFISKDLSPQSRVSSAPISSAALQQICENSTRKLQSTIPE